MTATQKKWLKWAILSLIVISLAALAYWYFKPKPQKPNYITANVERSDIENSVMSTGKIEGIKQVDVGAQVSGEVTKLYVEVGDTVKKGDVIAQIDPVTLQNTLTTQQATLQQSKANLESTKSAYQTKQAALATARADLKGKIATLQQSQTEYNRLKSLLAMNAISKQELEQADTAVKTAQANVDSAKEAIATAQANIASSQADIVSAQQTIKKSQTDVNTAEKNLGYSQIVAPMSGTVISITTKQGQTVNANQSAPTIVTLADLSSVRVKAKISEADVVNLKVGLPVYFNIIGRPDKKYQATLSTIGPAPDGTTASDSSTSTDSAIYYIGYFTVPNPDGALRINMTAQVYIVAAIKTDPKMGSYVEVVQADGTTKKQAVKTGVTNRITTQILSGVNQGDKVVVGQATVSKSRSSSKNKGGPPMM